MKVVIFIFLLASTILSSSAQETDLAKKYHSIAAYPESYSAETVAARMIDGLAFRYYWATEGLRQEDLDYKPSSEARTSQETIDHILSLSAIVFATAKGNPYSGIHYSDMTFVEKRAATLNYLEMASELLKSTDTPGLDSLMIKFQFDERSSEYPFWNLINGPISDAIWHVGQVVSFRRASGNPFNSNVSVLRGKLRE